MPVVKPHEKEENKVSELGEIKSLNQLNFEDFEVAGGHASINLKNLVDYENLNQKPIRIDDKELEKELQKDSVQEGEAYGHPEEPEQIIRDQEDVPEQRKDEDIGKDTDNIETTLQKHEETEQARVATMVNKANAAANESENNRPQPENQTEIPSQSTENKLEIDDLCEVIEANPRHASLLNEPDFASQQRKALLLAAKMAEEEEIKKEVVGSDNQLTAI
jgi:hypothetical protein